MELKSEQIGEYIIIKDNKKRDKLNIQDLSESKNQSCELIKIDELFCKGNFLYDIRKEDAFFEEFVNNKKDYSSVAGLFYIRIKTHDFKYAKEQYKKNYINEISELKDNDILNSPISIRNRFQSIFHEEGYDKFIDKFIIFMEVVYTEGNFIPSAANLSPGRTEDNIFKRAYELKAFIEGKWDRNKKVYEPYKNIISDNEILKELFLTDVFTKEWNAKFLETEYKLCKQDSVDDIIAWLCLVIKLIIQRGYRLQFGIKDNFLPEDKANLSSIFRHFGLDEDLA